MEMYNDDASLEGPGDSSSTENVVGPSHKRTSTLYGKGGRYSNYGTDEDMLARAIQDMDEDAFKSQRPRTFIVKALPHERDRYRL